MDVRLLTKALVGLLLLVGCAKDAPPADNTKLAKPDPTSECEDLRIPNQYFVKWQDGSYSVVTSEDDKSFEDQYLGANASQVLMAEPHYSVQIQPRESNDTPTPMEDLNWGARSISAPAAWENGALGEGIIVAVIDSGVDMSHPELVESFSKNPNEEDNGIDDDGNGLIDDLFGYDFVSESANMVDRTGHGTHVTGIIAANHASGHITGIAPSAKILPLSFINESGLGSINAAIRSIRYAASRGAKIINASWGGSNCSLALKSEINLLRDQNILFISAAGNSGQNLNSAPEYPAAFDLDNLVTVGASTVDAYTAGFSNYGSLVDVVAPGAFILSTFPEQFDFPDDEGEVDGIQALDGTSMSTPFVAGAAALLWSQKPEASYIEIVQALLKSVDKGYYPVATRGQINIQSALDLLLQNDEE